MNRLIEILGDFGVKITKNGHGDYTFKADDINFDYVKSKEFKKDGAKLRGSIMPVSYTHLDVYKRQGCYDCHSNESKYPWYSNAVSYTHLDVYKRQAQFTEHLMEQFTVEVMFTETETETFIKMVE